MVNMRQALGVDDFNQMSNYTGQLQNKRRSVGQKDYGLGGKALDMAAALGDAYNQYQPPETALGMMALPAKAVYGLGNMIVQDVGDKTKSIMGTDRSNPAAMNQAATDAFGLAADTMAGGGVVSRMTDMPTGAVLGANVFQGGPHKYGPEGAAESLKHMSKGEGAQAYGWGRYDAENDIVAGQYRANVRNIDEEAFKKAGFTDSEIKTARQYASQYLPEESDMAASAFSHWLGKELKPETNLAFKEAMGEGSYLYKHDLPDKDIARYLDWDAPLSEQPEIAKALDAMLPLSAADKKQMTTRIIKLQDRLNRRKDYDPYVKNTGDVEANDRIKEEIQQLKATILDRSLTGRELHNQVVKELGSSQAVSETLAKAGIPGLKYYDGMSRNKPTKDIKKSFQDELPDDAGFDEIDDLLGTGHFSPDSEEILQALKGDDWFGFDYPSQAISAALGKNINNWDPSARLTQAIAKAREGGTRNFVTWDQDVLNRMKLLERNGESMVDALSGVNNK